MSPHFRHSLCFKTWPHTFLNLALNSRAPPKAECIHAHLYNIIVLTRLLKRHKTWIKLDKLGISARNATVKRVSKNCFTSKKGNNGRVGKLLSSLWPTLQDNTFHLKGRKKSSYTLNLVQSPGFMSPKRCIIVPSNSWLELTKNSRPHASAATSVREHKISP